MKILDIIHNPSTVEVIVEVNSEIWKLKVKSAIHAEMKKVKIDGFRVGKVPANIAIKYINRASIYENVLNKIINKIVTEVEENKKFKDDQSEIVGVPYVDFKEVSDENCTIVLKYELAPVITLPEYTKIKLENLKDMVVEEKEIDDEINNLLKYEIKRKKIENKDNKEELEDLKLTDELVSKWEIENVKTVKELREWIKKQLMEVKKLDNRDTASKQIAKFLLENTKVSHVPQSFIHEQATQQLNSLNDKLATAKISREQYLKMLGITNEEFIRKIMDEAKNSVIVSLALEEIIEKEKIEATEQEIEEYILKLNKLYNLPIEKFNENLNEAQRNYIKTSILNNNVFDKLIELNKNN